MTTQLTNNVETPGFLYETPHIWHEQSLPTSRGNPLALALTSLFNSSLEKQLYLENY